MSLGQKTGERGQGAHLIPLSWRRRQGYLREGGPAGGLAPRARAGPTLASTRSTRAFLETDGTSPRGSGGRPIS